MILKKRVKLDDQDYYVYVDLEYVGTHKDTALCMKNFKDNYFDGGDFTLLLEKISENFPKYKKQTFTDIPLLDESLYIYKYVPFLSAVEAVYISLKDNQVYSSDYITKEELDKYIKENDINFEINENFELWNGRTWGLYEED